MLYDLVIKLGISQIKNGKVYVRWENVSKYLSQHVGKGDWITEPQFYKLAFKASNEVAEKFQDWVASEVLPAIRKHGAYMTDQKAFDVVHNKNGLDRPATTSRWPAERKRMFRLRK
ncbi:putative antirepressor [Lactobacillus phage Ld3]|uniref:Putative antirepressor n=1 Tax=Lactobacillus phage Ld3 TaxID=1500735 RepID=A0A075KLA6_9CAUD|nr:anti-repressor Ant [Lactobacillus phage Ld3]AIF54462.1 putative antirepressor [Lactobacillus phage Ld3]